MYMLNFHTPVTKNQDLITFGVSVFDSDWFTMDIMTQIVIGFRDGFLTTRQRPFSQSSWKIRIYNCITVSVCGWYEFGKTITTLHFGGKWNTLREICHSRSSNRSNTGLYSVTIIYFMKCPMNSRKSSPVIHSDLLLSSRRYHRNRNNFQSVCKRSDIKDWFVWDQWVQCLRMRWKRLVRFHVRLLYELYLWLCNTKKYNLRYHYGARGSVVMLCYKPEGRWFESRWGHWIFQLT
jgi:hypothetical protein